MQSAGDGGRGVLGWILLVGGIVVGAIVVLGVIGFVMSKRAAAQMPPAADRACRRRRRTGHAAGAPAEAEAARSAPHARGRRPACCRNGRPIPALAHHRAARAPASAHLLRHGFLIGKQPGCDLADRRRLHVEPARADRDGRRRQLQALRPRLDQRHVTSTACASPTARSSTASPSGSARPRCGSWHNEDDAMSKTIRQADHRGPDVPRSTRRSSTSASRRSGTRRARSASRRATDPSPAVQARRRRRTATCPTARTPSATRYAAAAARATA